MISAHSAPLDVRIPTADGLNLLGWHWKTANPRGLLVVAHGFGEHGGCYRHVAEALGPESRMDVLSPDLRGHGRSPGKRGVVRDFSELVSDLFSAVQWIQSERPNLPTFLLSHSNGGLVALRLAMDPVKSKTLAGLIASNPALQVSTPVPRYKLWLGRILYWLAPEMTLGAKLNADILTHDPAIRLDHMTDPLRHSRISAPLFFGMLDAGRFVVRHADQITLPLLLILSGQDQVIDPIASQLAFDKFASADKSLAFFPDMLHEPLNEIDREQVFGEIIPWLNARIALVDGTVRNQV